MLMAAGEDNTLRLFNIDGDLIWKEKNTVYGRFKFSEDGSMLSVSGPDDTLAMYTVGISIIHENELQEEGLSEISRDHEEDP